jgi:TolB protein
MLKRITLSLIFAFVLSIPVAAGAAPPGAGPADALWPVGHTQTVAPNSSQWYKFDVGGKKADVTATLDAASSDGLRLAIYTPDQVASWLDGGKLQPVGAGAPAQDHALAWYGEFNRAGTYYAVVHNDSPAPLEVRLAVTGDSVTTGAPEPPVVVVPDDPLMPKLPVAQGINGKLVFVDASGGNIYTVNGDGTGLRRISYGMDPQWNAAGTKIALARQGPVAGVFVVDADGGSEQLLYATNEPRSPDWSPDGSEIVFSYQGATRGGGVRCFRDRCFELPSSVEWKLGSVNLADGAYHDVRSSGTAFTPAWNADGTIVYNDTSIGLMQTSSTGEPAANPFIGDLRITSDSYNPLRIMSPQYSPDGSRIVYMVMQSPTWQIAIANADGSDQRLLTRDVVLALTHPSSVAPVWSPDGTQILFLSNRNGRWEFFVMNADGSNPHQVLKNVTDRIELRYDYQAAGMVSWSE